MQPEDDDDPKVHQPPPVPLAVRVRQVAVPVLELVALVAAQNQREDLGWWAAVLAVLIRAVADWSRRPTSH
ncbi:hypothetical protein [Polymorphospora sp. NPDC050346]|uniref:hypothetical protein n=1 Tax=Polymorphospora sp. NPDC050346 TaxID=3155780 RepID=UPI0033CE66A2